MRPALFTLLTACGRFDFAAVPDAGETDAALQDATTYPWIARYPMDDDPSTGMITAIPASYSVPCVSCPATGAGRISGGYAFSGAQRIPLLHPELIGRTPFSMTLWMRPAVGATGFMSMVSKPRDLTSVLNVASITLFVDTGGFAWETSVGSSIVTVGTTLDLSSWHHIAATWDGTTRRLFVDGVSVAMDQAAFDDSGLDVAIGGDLDGGVEQIYFTGDLDELRFYDRPLDATEIAALANP